MSRTLVILRREFHASFESPIAYVTIVLFVLVLNCLFFFLGFPIGDLPLPNLWQGDQATLIVLFHWLPLLLAFFVPALTMGAWADEQKSGTEELLLTQPVHGHEIVLGKFFAAWLLVALFTAAAVLPVAVTVASLGDLDWSAAWIGLLGANALSAAYVALALLISATTREPLVAFLVSALTLLGLWSLRLLIQILPANYADVLDTLSPLAHFLETSARGLFDLRDLVYFGSLCASALWANALLVQRRRWA